ncbi:glycosyl transferase family 90-domain-containing protein [Mycena alexandri]|uniref:Glycosyl transferase family 90-domain-containing protein n=1 Tax=Mycena alexandri TaxID=1745969 RepID=A0AAD6WTT7_9AGAR|nr:glycosyl transferase family 90-domain-containing protein [Mycena alexandri]
MPRSATGDHFTTLTRVPIAFYFRGPLLFRRQESYILLHLLLSLGTNTPLLGFSNNFYSLIQVASIQSGMNTVEHIFHSVADSTILLIPLHDVAQNSRELEDDATAYYKSLPGRHSRQNPRRRCLVLTTALVVASTILVLILRTRLAPVAPTSSTSPNVTTTLPRPDDAASLARLAVDAVLAAQSSTLPEASARYTLRNQRATPPYYDRWFKFAQDKKCLVDDYDQIRRDFEPFYQLAERDPEYFQAIIERGSKQLEAHPAEIALVEIRDGGVSLRGDTAYGGNWPDTLGRFSQSLPNMTFLLNGRDEPRVAFNYRAANAVTMALSPNDSTPFIFQPRPTVEFFQHQSGCIIPKTADGFVESANDASGFLLATAKPGFTTDFYPMLSMSRISPCFSDILFPTEYHYTRSWWYGKYAYPDNINWEDKISKVYWRGMSNGGMIIGENYHQFARFKLIDIGREHPDLMDVSITRFAETLCEEGCDRDAVRAEYNITDSSEPREDLYHFKYAMDVDGTTFSGRFLGLMRSGSLVFKSTLFEEYFNDWLRPFEHYIPVKSDLSDLVQQIRWANDNPAEARLIQQRGMEMAKRVVTDDQNDCYFFAVLLEWARLQEMAKTTLPSADQK